MNIKKFWMSYELFLIGFIVGVVYYPLCSSDSSTRALVVAKSKNKNTNRLEIMHPRFSPVIVGVTLPAPIFASIISHFLMASQGKEAAKKELEAAKNELEVAQSEVEKLRRQLSKSQQDNNRLIHNLSLMHDSIAVSQTSLDFSNKLRFDERTAYNNNLRDLRERIRKLNERCGQTK